MPRSGSPREPAVYPSARQVDGAIARALRQQRVVRVDGADDLQRPLLRQGGAETSAGGGGIAAGIGLG